MPELGGSQISALLESVPGIASVLRSPVADALINMIRAGAGVGDFVLDDADELVQYAVRRGLISGDEGDQLLTEVKKAAKMRTAKARGAKKPKAAKARARNKPKKTARSTKKRAASTARKVSKTGGARAKRR